ncbi:hypothetical protein QMK33_12905 [Hymenobacter sp. H14-R3]|uniref:hypothetical protein n=1 Tax=Hymenobacter sp. H14-R3 TaxID=3046308 RepID=UPI0024BA1868|nr:hypothetical protein [Hymenobacter sp. H14-R3]MDJ0366056.1 hypothetical protein [Hymenobacter sp. H14-R3]
MRIPPEIEAFITQEIEVGQMCLPDHYPTAANFSDFQAGYRYNAVTKEDITGTLEGDFKPTWYLIAANYFDDPFYVDFSESDLGFPVYFSYHGAGSWTPLKVSATLFEFTTLLTKLVDLQEDADAYLRTLRSVPEAENEFWQEVITSYETRDEE